jgi:hypothetical protein
VSWLKKNSFFSILFIISLIFSSCGNSDNQNKEETYILQSQDIVITSADFTEELELRKASYAYNIKDFPTEYNNIVMQIVKDLSEEIVLLHTARENGIFISDEDFKKAEAVFLKDYPGDAFEDMLLKNAVEYSFWKKRFIKRLIIDRLIQQELREKIVINTEDVVEFYKKYKKEGRSDLSEDELIVQLREQKTQEKYNNWIDKAIVKYPIDINKEGLKSFLIGLNETGK